MLLLLFEWAGLAYAQPHAENACTNSVHTDQKLKGKRLAAAEAAKRTGPAPKPVSIEQQRRERVRDIQFSRTHNLMLGRNILKVQKAFSVAWLPRR